MLHSRGESFKLGEAAFGKYNWGTGEYEGNEELAETLFDLVDWQHPETLYNELELYEF